MYSDNMYASSADSNPVEKAIGAHTRHSASLCHTAVSYFRALTQKRGDLRRCSTHSAIAFVVLHSPPDTPLGELQSSTRPAMKHERATLPTPTSTNSFWHSEPNEFIFGHRTTEELPAEADVVIVGSGITGTSAARFLAEDKRAKGKSIVLLEAREACWGATGRVSALSPAAGNAAGGCSTVEASGAF